MSQEQTGWLMAGAAVAATVLKTGAQAIKRAAPALNGAANIVLAPAEVARSVREERQVGLINAATVYVENNYQIELRDPRQILPF